MTLKDISKILTKLSDGKDLTVEETKRAFDVCIIEDKEGYCSNECCSIIIYNG